MASLFEPFVDDNHHFHLDAGVHPRRSGSFPVSSARDESDGPLARLELSNGNLHRRPISSPTALSYASSSTSSATFSFNAPTAFISHLQKHPIRTYAEHDVENRHLLNFEPQIKPFAHTYRYGRRSVIQPFTPPRTSYLSSHLPPAPSVPYSPSPAEHNSTPSNHVDPSSDKTGKRKKREERVPHPLPCITDDDEDQLDEEIPPTKKQVIIKRRRGGPKKRRGSKAATTLAVGTNTYKPSPLRHSVLPSPEPEPHPVPVDVFREDALLLPCKPFNAHVSPPPIPQPTNVAPSRHHPTGDDSTQFELTRSPRRTHKSIPE